MPAHALIDAQVCGLATRTSAYRSNWLAARVPRRSTCNIQEIPLAGGVRTSTPDRHEADQGRQHQGRIWVSRTPAPNCSSSHQLFLERGTQFRKFDIPASSRVEVRQRFAARAGDQLSFDYMVQLNPVIGCRPAVFVRATLVNLATSNAHLILERSVDGMGKQKGLPSNSRETLTLRVWAAGEYELRTATSIDPTCSGAEAHLMIDSVRVMNTFGTETRRLASLSCVGRVTR